MKHLIAHRGNLEGPKKDQENKPEYLNKALAMGYDVEVDIWVLNYKIYLGHDFPQYEVEEDYIRSISNKAWFHCKNFGAIDFLSSSLQESNYFWHQSDKFTLTSKGFIWTYPGEETSGNSVIVDLSGNAKQNNYNCYAICADYIL
jgi:hypothetical protein